MPLRILSICSTDMSAEYKHAALHCCFRSRVRFGTFIVASSFQNEKNMCDQSKFIEPSTFLSRVQEKERGTYQ